MEMIPYDEFSKQAHDAKNLLGNENIFTTFTQEELLEYGIFYIPPGLDVRFVHIRFMKLFEPFKHNMLNFLKLHNFNKAAIAVSFNSKHKYATTKNVSRDKIEGILLEKLAKMEDSFDERVKLYDINEKEQKEALVQYCMDPLNNRT